MLEIFVLIVLCKNIGKILRAKGRKPLLFQIMTVVLWFGGEFVGGILYGVALLVAGKPIPADGFDLTLYLVALIGAAVGAGLSFLIAHVVPPVEQSTPLASPQQQGYSPNPDFAPPPVSNNPYNPYDQSRPFGGK